jgi:hypothetical protein
METLDASVKTIKIINPFIEIKLMILCCIRKKGFINNIIMHSNGHLGREGGGVLGPFPARNHRVYIVKHLIFTHITSTFRLLFRVNIYNLT